MRKRFLTLCAVVLILGLMTVVGQRFASGARSTEKPNARGLPYTPVVTPNGSTLPWKMVKGVKEFHLVVEEIEWEVAPGMIIKAWGYNGRTPGPTIQNAGVPPHGVLPHRTGEMQRCRPCMVFRRAG